MVNWDNAEKVLDAIDAEPKAFDMRAWQGIGVCGTTRCIAGWAAHLAGWKLTNQAYTATRGTMAGGDYEHSPVWKVAVDFLGLDVSEKDIQYSETGPFLSCESDVYFNLFSPYAFGELADEAGLAPPVQPTTDEIRARLKEFDK